MLPGLALLRDHLVRGAREEFRTLLTGFAGETPVAIRLKLTRPNAAHHVHQRIGEVFGEVVLPSQTWERVLAANEDALFAVKAVLAFYGGYCLYWSLVYAFVLPSAFGGAAPLLVQLSVIGLCIALALASFMFLGRAAIRAWINHRLRSIEASSKVCRIDKFPFIHTGWAACGRLGSPYFMSMTLCVTATMLITVADLLTGFSSEILSIGIVVPLAAGALMGGRAMLHFVVIINFIFLVVGIAVMMSPTLRELRLSKRLTITEERFIECSTSIAKVIFVSMLQEIVRARIVRTEMDTQAWAANLLWDLRTPLHGILGEVQELIDIDNTDVLHSFALSCDLARAQRSLSGNLSLPGITSASRPVRLKSEPGCEQFCPNPAHTILECATTMHEVLENVCRFAPIKNIAVEPARKTVSLSSLVERLQCLFASSARQKRQRTKLVMNDKVFLASKVPCSVARIRMCSGTVGDVWQIMLNLVSNSAEFTPVGGLLFVSVSLRKVPGMSGAPASTYPCGQEASSRLRIRVEDSGPGVPLSLRKSIFEYYEQGRPLRGTKGSGLGLFVAKSCAIRLNGTIACVDRPNGARGACFVVEIPCVTIENRSYQPNLNVRSSGHFVPKYVPDRMGNVLIVDDNALNVRILRRLLEKAGFNQHAIISFFSAEEALESIQRSPQMFGLAIVDLQLPKMNGIELTRELLLQQEKLRLDDNTTDHPTLVVVGATATATVSTVIEWKAAGAAFHMPKPFGLEKLEKVLCQVFRKQQRSALSAEGLLTEEISQRRFSTHEQVMSAACDVRAKEVFQFRLLILSLVAFPACFGLLIAGQFAVGFFVLLLGILFFLVSQAWGWRPVRGRELSFAAIIFAGSIMFGTLRYWCKSRGSVALVVFVSSWHGRTKVAWVVGAVLFEVVVFSVSFTAANESFFCIAPHGSPETLLFVDMALLYNMAGMFLIQLSFAAQARSERERWVHTLNHDMRVPLDGIFVAIRDLNGKRNTTVPHAVDALSTCASALMATIDTTLQLTQHFVNVQLAQLSVSARSQQPILVQDITLFCQKQLATLVERRFLDFRTVGPSNISERACVVGPRLALFFVLSKFLAFVPFHRSPFGTVSLKVIFKEQVIAGRNGTSCLLIEAFERTAIFAEDQDQVCRPSGEVRQAQAGAQSVRKQEGTHGQSLRRRRGSEKNAFVLEEPTTNATSVLAEPATSEISSETVGTPSSFGQALRYIIHGRMELMLEPQPELGEQIAWKLTLIIPTAVAGLQQHE